MHDVRYVIDQDDARMNSTMARQSYEPVEIAASEEDDDSPEEEMVVQPIQSIAGSGGRLSALPNRTKWCFGFSLVVAVVVSLIAVVGSRSVHQISSGALTSSNVTATTGQASSFFAGEHIPQLSECNDGKYTKRTLRKSYELKFSSLFVDDKGQSKYEASDVVVVGEYAYAVCDSSWAISKFELVPFSDTNLQVGDPAREKEDSDYEAIFHDDGYFYAVRESVKHPDKKYRSIIEKLSLGPGDQNELIEACSSEFEFEGSSKGFEGAIGLRDLNNELVILALCEGNFCSEERKFESGNGRVVAMKRVTLDDGSCQWSTIRIINLPAEADFRDYSAITIDDTDRVAITSQEDSKLWISHLNGRTDAGLWNIDAISFDVEENTTYDFPKNDQCEVVYCNIEGAFFLNPRTIMTVSDKMKSKGKQDFRCFDKDQSAHIFTLP